MSKRDIIVFLFKWKFSLIGYFLFIVATVTVLVYLLPQKYEASASVLVESNRAPVMRSDVAYGVEQISALNTEAYIVRSKAVLESTVDIIGVVEDDEPSNALEALIDNIGSWMIEVGLREPISSREIMIKSLEDDLKVEPLANSNVINISLKGKNPELIANTVNAVTDSYIEQHLRIFSTAGAADIYRQQVERLGGVLDRKRATIAAYKSKMSVSALDETISALVRQQAGLNQELSDQRRELAELKTRFGEGHTKVELTEASVRDTTEALAAIQKELKQLELNKTSINNMEMEASAIEKSYIEYKKRYEEERLNDLANTDVVNVRIISYAEAPLRPNHSRIFYIILSIAGGLIFSVAIALIKEYFDHRVYDPETVTQIMGIPSLGSIEKI